MPSISLVALLAAVATANPVTFPRDEYPVIPKTNPFIGGQNSTLPKEYNATLWTPDAILKPDHVILVGEGKAEIVHVDVYEKYIEPLLTGTIDHTVQEGHGETRNVHHTPSHWDTKRDCQVINTAITDRTENFIDWDVQMAPLVRGPVQVIVTEGYTVGNSLNVAGEAGYTWTKDVLIGALGIDYGHQWMTTYQVSMNFPIHAANTGTIVTKPVTTRRFGRILSGCIGRQVLKSTFTATSHPNGGSHGLNWVQGVVAACEKRIPITASLSRCNGGGYFI